MKKIKWNLSIPGIKRKRQRCNKLLAIAQQSSLLAFREPTLQLLQMTDLAAFVLRDKSVHVDFMCLVKQVPGFQLG